MFGVYRSLSLPDVMHFRNLLETRGIACHVRNYHSASVLGETLEGQFAQCWRRGAEGPG